MELAESEQIRKLKTDLDELRAALAISKTQNEQSLRDEIAQLETLIGRVGPFPLPPVDLRMHVGAKPAASNFMNQGWSSSRKVLSVFGGAPTSPVLDWGCGSGRTLWWLWKHETWREAYHGTDVDPEALAFLRDAGITQVRQCDGSRIHLPYPDGFLGGVFSFSVLTHIHPDLFSNWLSEIARVLKPGATVYLTFNGDTIAESKEDRHQEAGETFRRTGVAWLENPGHFKSAAFIRADIMEAWAGAFFDVKKIARRDYGPMDALHAIAR